MFGLNLTRGNVGQPTSALPVYLPGVTVASEATVIELRPGDRAALGVIRLNDR